jgi:V/A-type H+-transporting ATPase subunit I
MIVPMKRVSLIVLAYEKRSALKALRKAGIVHVDEIPVKNERLEDLEKARQRMEKAMSQLRELRDHEGNGKKTELPMIDVDSTDDEDFSDIHARVLWLIDQKNDLEEQRQKTIIERDRLAEWGDFSPKDIQELHRMGIDLNFYRLGKKEIARIPKEIAFVKLSEVGKSLLIATIGKVLPEEVVARNLTLGEASLSELERSIESITDRVVQIRTELLELSGYLDCYTRQLAVIGQELRFETIQSSMGEDDTVSWLSGYMPAEQVDGFKELAATHKWAYALDDPSEEENPPTKVKNRRWISIIGPVFDILGTVPGYREYDISMWFLMFFSLFFAMIVGDGAYGLIFLITAILIHSRMKKATNAVVLLYVLSTASIVWGALTGTWFGSKAILEAVPFLRMLVVPRIANYPELFGLEATTTQNMVMQFCFVVGTLQLSLACAMNIHRKVGKRDLSAVADIGWLLMIDALYFLVLMLVINAAVDVALVGTIVGVGFLLVVLFGAQGPGIPFLKGLAGGAANLFTTFLDSISAFSNIISYIRLFAVGMASLAIAQSFNNMASGLLQGFALPAGILVLVVGHGLNLIMALLSVVVHGVRLNLLEFSGQLGMEWTGYTYDPFRETVETSSQTL